MKILFQKMRSAKTLKMKWYRRSKGITPLTRWKWVVNFMSRRLYCYERTPVPIQYEVVWAPEPVWRFCGIGNLLPLPGIRTPGRPACSPVTISNTLTLRICIRKVPVRMSVGLAPILIERYVVFFSMSRRMSRQRFQLYFRVSSTDFSSQYTDLYFK
jgi:hypothetical protein